MSSSKARNAYGSKNQRSSEIAENRRLQSIKDKELSEQRKAVEDKELSKPTKRISYNERKTSNKKDRQSSKKLSHKVSKKSNKTQFTTRKGFTYSKKQIQGRGQKLLSQF